MHVAIGCEVSGENEAMGTIYYLVIETNARPEVYKYIKQAKAICNLRVLREHLPSGNF